MLKIPLQFVKSTYFPDHGWRFGKLQAFYININDTNAIYETYSITTDISDDESNHDSPKKLNLKAGRLIQNLGIDMYEYDELREFGFVGYASYYLKECWDQSKLTNKADVAIYRQLLEIDSKLGTTSTEQLDRCVFCSHQMDIIKV